MADPVYSCGTGGWSGPKPGDPDNNAILSVVPASGAIDVSWTYPTVNPFAVSYTIIYRGTSNDFSLAIERSRVSGSSFYDRIASIDNQEYFYWIQFVSINGTTGALIGPESATPTLIRTQLVAELLGQIGDGMLTPTLRSQIDVIPLIQMDVAAKELARLADNAALGAALSSVQTETGQALVYIQQEMTARTSADQALLTSVDALAVGMANNAAALVNEVTLRANSDNAIAADITTLYTKTADNLSAVSSEISSRTTADTALGSRIDSLVVTVSGNTSAIETESTARTSLASSIATQLTNIQAATTAAISAAVQTETTARATTESSLTTAVNTAQSKADSAYTNAGLAQTAAVAAQTAATNAANSAATANNTLADIANDNLLTQDEKPEIVRQYDSIIAEKSGIDTQATSYGVTTEKTAYDTAVASLTTYLATLTTPVLWSNLAGTTTIVGTTFRTKFKDVYSTRQDLFNAVTTVTKTKVDTAQSTANNAVTASTANAAAIQSESTTRADAVTALSSSVTTLQTTANGLTTSIAAQATSLNGLSAQYTVKIDNNGYITGFGLASQTIDSAPISEFNVVANNFRFGAPDGVKTPFAIVDSGGGIYKTLLNSDVLIGGDLNIANLKTGSLASDVMLRLGDGTIELDGAGEIRVFKDTAANADFVRLSSGQIRFMRFIGGAYQTYNYLSRIEAGLANSGATVSIPGYWKAQPKVMVSPAMLSLYKKAYASQDQAISCEAKSLVETSPGSGQWQFVASATLNLDAAIGGGSLNVTSGAITGANYTTATQTTPANCTNITPTVSLLSVRGDGAGLYFNRTVRWRVEYFNGTSWITTAAWRNVNIGDTTTVATTDSVLFNFPSAGTWQWRIYSEAFDTSTTKFGSVTYDTTTEVASNMTASAVATWSSQIADGSHSQSSSGTDINFGVTHTPLAGWELVSSTINVETSYEQSQGGVSLTTTYGFEYNTQPAITPYMGNMWDTSIYGNGYGPSVGTYWYSPGARTVSGHVTSINLHCYANYSSGWRTQKAKLRNLSITYNYRKPQPNSTTASNTYTLASYNYSLSTAQVLATGSVNWQAIGE